MKQTASKRPFARYNIDDPEYGDVIKVVHPKDRVILENRGAQPGANIIVLLQASRQ